MSGEPKTLTLTTRHGYAPVTYEMDEDNTIHRITLHLPPGAAWAGPDGAPVAARDEAAELRAAIKAWAEALDAESGAQSAAYAAAQHEQGYEATYAAWQAAKDRLGEAEERLYALAAPEAQP